MHGRYRDSKKLATKQECDLLGKIVTETHESIHHAADITHQLLGIGLTPCALAVSTIEGTFITSQKVHGFSLEETIERLKCFWGVITVELNREEHDSFKNVSQN